MNNQSAYKLFFEDFKRVFKFATDFYLDPNKNTTGRTTAEPRGLGAILDSFTLGKLTEIGVEKILTIINNNKNYILDFDIKSNNEVQNEPDIVAIFENNITRKPNLFIEIKNTSENDRWIGLTEEQFNTIKRSASDRDIILIYASINSEIKNNNYKTTDLSGMFLKNIEDIKKSQIFQQFADLNAECKIEFILSAKDLEKYGYHFDKGMKMYETKLFNLKKESSFYTKNGARKDILKIENYENYNDVFELKLMNNKEAENKEISLFKICGSFEIFYKKSSSYIKCKTDVDIYNDIFGSFSLKKGNFYNFNLLTIGRDPILKRNNIFIAKNRIFQLISEGKINNTAHVLEKIAEFI